MANFSHCIIHNTFPKDDEPCWACINQFGDKQFLRYRRLLASQANLMHHLSHTQQISAEEAMERAATIEKVLEGG